MNLCKVFFLRTAPLACVLAAGCSGDSAGSPQGNAPTLDAAPVVVGAVMQRDFTPQIEGLGTARAQESVLVTSRVSGRVEQIFFTEGAQARVGQPLVRLEDDEERAELAAAQAAADQADSRYRRLQELTAQGLIPKDQLEEQAQLQRSAQARLELARVRLAQRTVRAPFAGVLGFRQVSPGTLVQPGSAIVSLDAVQTLRVEFSVPEVLVGGLTAGTPIQARAAGYPDRIFDGTISVIGTRVDEVTRAIPVQAAVANGDGLLKPGMLLVVHAQAGTRRASFVPEAAVMPEYSEQFVWRITADKTAEKVRVLLGARIPGQVEVVSGVSPGDRVVVEGHTNLRPGRAVREVERPAAS
jgi:membrane fusion protein, multidrug efflux system